MVWLVNVVGLFRCIFCGSNHVRAYCGAGMWKTHLAVALGVKLLSTQFPSSSTGSMSSKWSGSR